MKIFISYRRADSRSFTERIYDRLSQVFGADNIFVDVDDIPVGEDFRLVLRDAVASCDIVLVIIGNHWLSITDEHGNRRLDDPNDFVRIEVESSLNHSKLVIPLLIGDAKPPPEISLPESMQDLAFRNAARIRYNPDFSRDMERLIERLKTFEQTTLADLLRQQAPEIKIEEVSPKENEYNEIQVEEAPPLSVRVLDQSPPEPVDRLGSPSEQAKSTATYKLTPKSIPASLIQGCAGLTTFLFLLPLLFVLVLAFKDNATIYQGDTIELLSSSISLENWRTLFTEIDALGSFLRSLIYSTLVGILAMIIGVPTAYGLSRFDSNNSGLLFAMLLPRLLPSLILMIPLFLILVNFDLINTWLAVVIVQVTLVLPYAVLIMRDYFVDRDREVEDAAQVDGADFPQLMRLVVLPQARPAILATFTVCFIFAWNDLGSPLIFTSSRELWGQTIQLSATQANFAASTGIVAPMIIWVVVLPVIVSLFVRRYIFHALSLGIAKS